MAVYTGDDYNNAASSAAAAVVVTAPDAVLYGLSTRAKVISGDDIIIGGIGIGASSSKKVIIRGRGPSLTASGVPNALPNPMLYLFGPDGSIIASNGDWQSAPNAAEISASGFAPAHSLDSAILMDLHSGAYTAMVVSADGQSGAGLVEVYELDHPDVPITSLSTRAPVLGSNDLMIGGFIITGSEPLTVVVRARGPSLAASGIASPLANPSLQLIRASDNQTIASNDDWGAATNAQQLAASGFAPGYALESAILITLEPGAYTALVSGTGGSTGLGIFEVFAL